MLLYKHNNKCLVHEYTIANITMYFQTWRHSVIFWNFNIFNKRNVLHMELNVILVLNSFKTFNANKWEDEKSNAFQIICFDFWVQEHGKRDPFLVFSPVRTPLASHACWSIGPSLYSSAPAFTMFYWDYLDLFLDWGRKLPLFGSSKCRKGWWHLPWTSIDPQESPQTYFSPKNCAPYVTRASRPALTTALFQRQSILSTVSSMVLGTLQALRKYWMNWIKTMKLLCDFFTASRSGFFLLIWTTTDECSCKKVNWCTSVGRRHQESNSYVSSAQ